MKSNIEEWQEALSSLPDENFFDLIRLYLGEIKTPYNKIRLIEQLARFIRLEKNTRNIISLLDDFDISFLTAIFFINNTTEEILIKFFSTEYSLSEIYAEISNLKARLLIYSKSEGNGKTYLYLNPLLEDELIPYINIKNILPKSEIVSRNINDTFVITPNFIISFISFVKKYGISCKLDGDIKKNDLVKIQEIFAQKTDVVKILIKSFINLRILIEKNKKYIIDDVRLQQFSEIPFVKQISLICVASCTYLSRDGLKKESQLLLDTLVSVSQNKDVYFSRETIIKIAFIISNSRGEIESIPKGRFGKILEEARSVESVEKNIMRSDIIDCAIDCAISLGILYNAGFDSKNIPIYTVTKIEEPELDSIDEVRKVINIETTFSVIILPGLTMKQMLPLSDFLEIKSCGIVTTFEITKKSVSAAFDKGWTPEKIYEIMKLYSVHEIPQNLLVIMNEWYDSYNSARLYCGYVLKVNDNNINYVENNPNIKKYIKEKLVSGVYLLNVPINEDISFFINESGLDFLGNIKDSSVEGERLPFPVLRDGKSLYFSTNSSIQKVNFLEAKSILDELKSNLEKMELTKNQRESLAYKVHNRMIISPEQLSVSHVKLEVLEAEGMDYVGKIHLIDAAVTDGDMIEITLPQYNKSTDFFTLVGKPILLYKQESDAILKMQIEPEKVIENFSVSRITHVKRMKY